MKFSIKYFLSKRNQIRLVIFRIWPHLLNKSFMENFIFCAVNVPLKYYATFKVSKSEWFFYKINTCLQKTTTCIGLPAEQIFLVNK